MNFVTDKKLLLEHAMMMDDLNVYHFRWKFCPLLIKKKQCNCSSVMESFISKCRFKHFIGFCGHLSKFHSGFSTHIILCQLFHTVMTAVIMCTHN